MKKFIYSIVFIALLSFSAFADIRLPDTPKPTATPKPQKSIDGNMTIKLDKNAKEAKLIIPKSQIKQLRAQLDELDDANNEPFFTFSRTQTIVSGLFLSLAIVFGGVWFSRSHNGKNNKKIIAGAVLFFIGAAATMVFANAGVPSDLRSISGKLFDKKVFDGYGFAYGNIKIETSDEFTAVVLIVPDKDEEKPTNKEE